MKKNMVFVSISVILLILLGIGVSYSMWNMSISQETSNVIATTSECFDIKLTNQNNNINLENAYPISNEKGKALTPFTFTIKNTCDMFLSYTVSLESLKGSTLDSRFINVMVNNEAVERLSNYEITDTVNEGSIESRILAKGSLSKDDSNDYSLRLWIDYDTTMEDLDNETKVLKSKVVIKATPSTWNPVSEGYNTLHDAILANEYQTTPAKALEKIKAKDIPDLSKTAPVIIFNETTSEDITTKSYIKPSKSAINSDSATNQLSMNDTYLTLYKSITHDQSSGTYYMTNAITVDPTTLDFSSNQEYYINVEYIATNQVNQKIYTWKNDQGSTIYKVVGATKSDSKSSWNSVTYDSITYTLQVKELSNKTSSDARSDKGLYETYDNDGKTYYYRGDVKNNNVYFAGFKWQIVRINGDGSIRLIYNETNLNNIQYNLNYKETKASNYMFGTNSSTREDILKNENDSNMKKYIDTWYETNLKDFGSYLADSGFCVDRQLYSGDGVNTTSDSFYQAVRRIDNHEPTLVCGNDSDLFTANSASKGNKSLKYPIGLITADEVHYAGLGKVANNKAWIYCGTTFWTMTPSLYTVLWGSAEIYTAYDGLGAYGDASRGYRVRPVINLRPDAEISGGIGTVNDPFIVKTS